MPRWFMCLCRLARLNAIKEHGRDRLRYAYIPERFRSANQAQGDALAGRPRRRGGTPERARVETLEPRLLFSGSPMASLDVFGLEQDEAGVTLDVLANDEEGSGGALSLTGFTPGVELIGDVNNGVLGDDGDSGTAYLMYSAQATQSRFADVANGQADHLIVVKHNGTDWLFNDYVTGQGDTWSSFTPVSSDVLVAQITMQGGDDAIASLEGESFVVEGIETGYASGDLAFIANQWQDVYNRDEFDVTGTTFTRNLRTEHGQLVDNGDGTLTYTPDAGFAGSDGFRYTVSDGQTYTVSASDLEAYYLFNKESGTTANDNSGNGLTLTLDGAGRTGGRPGGFGAFGGGGALLLDGADDFASATGFTSTSQMTLSAWVRPDALSGEQTIIGQSGSFALKLSGNRLRFTAPGFADHTAGTGDLVAGQWQHVAVSFDAGQAGGAKFYLNGELVATLNASSMGTNSNDLWIGKNQWGEFFGGAVDDVRIDSRLLTADEIATLAEASTAAVSLSVNASVDMEAARDTLLAGVTSLADPSAPGHLIAYGPTAFSVSNYAGADLSDSMIAAATWGAGRVVALPDHQWLELTTHGGDASTAAFYGNGIEWLADSAALSVKVVTYNHAAKASWLTAQGYTNVVNATSATLAAELADADVLVGGWLGTNPPEADLDTIRDFVANQGGGLFIADYGIGYDWWWGQAVEDIPSNRLLREAGIGFVKAYPHGGGTQTINRAVGQVTADDILALLNDSSGATQAEKDQAAAIYTTLNGLLAQDDALQAELDAAFWARINTINPTPSTPVSDSFEKALLRREMNLLGALPPGEVTAHRTAEDVYGAIDVNAPRLTNQSVTIDADTTGLIATGLYAVPGDLVTVTLPAALVGQGYTLRINNHVDSIAGHGSYARVPYNVSRSFAIDSTTVQVANAFGGHIYIDMGGQAGGTSSGLGSQQITIDGAIAAPIFVLGQTTDAEWINTIRDNPAPYAEFVSQHLVFSVPSDWIRALDNPTQLMQYWDDAVSFMDYVAGTDALRTGPDRINLDVSISVGLLHAGYPIQGPTSYGDSIVDYEALTSGGDWGWFHELGHEIQRQIALGWGWDNPWTFGGDVEVTVNIFANAALELMAPGTGTAGWGYSAHAEEVMARAVATINNTNSPDFDQKDPYPFYFQLADGFGWDMYRTVLGGYVDDAQNNPSALPGDNQQEKDQWLTRWSEATGYNLVDYMVNKWGLEVSQAAIDTVNAMTLPSWLPVVPGDTTLSVAHAGSLIFDPAAAGVGLNATATFVSVADPAHGTVTLNSNGTYTYTPDADFVGTDLIDVTYQSSAGNTVTTAIRVEVYQLAAQPDKAQWTLVSTDSEETVGENGAATNAFDGDPNTIWHTQWNGGSPTHPHELVIDLGGRYDLDGFTYTPRQSGTNGRIANYEFYTSNDGVTWGNPVTTGTFANNANPQSVTFASTAGRYIKLVALSEVNGNAWSSVAELDVSGTLAAPNADDFELVSVSSEETVGENGGATNAFDGDPGTIWHTQYIGGTDVHPHELVLDLGARFELDGFTYLPRQNGVNGRIADYAFYTSLDGINWGAAVATGTFANTADLQTVGFTQTTGQYIKLVALSEVNGNAWTSVAELGVSGVFASAGEVVPVAVDDTVDVLMDQANDLDVVGNDIDPDRGETFAINIIGQGTHGTAIDNGNGGIAYTPDAGYYGTDTITYAVTDSTGRTSNTATVTISVGGLVSHWALDEGTGTTAADTEVNNATGTITNATWTAGVHNNALDFNGQDSVVTLGTDASLEGTTDFTAAAWINTTDTNGGTIIQQRDATGPGWQGQYRFRMDDSGRLNFFIYNGGQQFSLTTDQTVNDGRWHHVVAQRDGLEGRIYIDGVLSASVTGNEVKALNGAIEVAIGANIRDNDDFFKGTIDDVQLHSRSMGATEVAALYQAMPNLTPAASADHLTTTANTPATISVLDNDFDHNAADTLSILSFTQGTSGVVTDNGDGTLTYTPNTGFGAADAQLDTFTYTVSDGNGGSTTAPVLVTVGDVQAPSDFNTTGGTTQVTATGNHQYELNLDFSNTPATIDQIIIDWGNGQISHGTSSGGWGADLTATGTNLWTATKHVYDKDQVQHIKVYAKDTTGKVQQSKVTLNNTQVPVYNVSAQAYSPTEVRLTWAERMVGETGYQISVSTDGGASFVPWTTAGADATAVILTGLTPGADYQVQITPLTEGDSSFTAGASTPLAVSTPQGVAAQQWYMVQLSQNVPSRGSAGYTDYGSNLHLRGDTVIDNGGGDVWELVLAGSEEAAIAMAVKGIAHIQSNDGNGDKQFDFEADAAFHIGTYGDLDANPAFDITTVLPNDQYLITLEDTFQWTNIDTDFDDWYWQVQVQDASAEIEISLTASHIHEAMPSVVFDTISVDAGESGELIVPLSIDRIADIEFEINVSGDAVTFNEVNDILDDLLWQIEPNTLTYLDTPYPSEGARGVPASGLITLAPPINEAPAYTLSVVTGSGAVIASIDLRTIDFLELNVADGHNLEHSETGFPGESQPPSMYVGADDNEESIVRLAPDILPEDADLWPHVTWQITGGQIQGPSLGTYDGPELTKTLTETIIVDGLVYHIDSWLDRDHNGQWDTGEAGATVLVEPFSLDYLAVSNDREPSQSVLAFPSQAAAPTLYATETVAGLAEIRLHPSITPFLDQFKDLVAWEITGGGVVGDTTGDFQSGDAVIQLAETGTTYTATVWIDIDEDGVRDADEIQASADIVSVGFDGLGASNIYWESVLATPDQVEPPRLWVPFVGGQGEVRLIPMFDPVADPQAGALVAWEITGEANPITGNFSGGDVDVTLNDKTVQYVATTWLDGNENGVWDSHEIGTTAEIEPVYVDSFTVEDTRNGNSVTADEMLGRSLSVPLDGMHHADIRLSVVLNGPADLLDDAMPFLSWDIQDPQENAGIESYTKDVLDKHFGPGDQVKITLEPNCQTVPEYIATVGWDFSGNERIELNEQATAIAVQTLALEDLTIESVKYPDIYTTRYSPVIDLPFEDLEWISIPVTDTDGNQAAIRFSVDALGGGALDAETMQFAWWEIAQRKAGVADDIKTVDGGFNADGTPNIAGPILLDLLELDHATEYVFRVGLDVDVDQDLENNEVRFFGEAFLYYFNVRIDSNNNTRLNADDDLVEEDPTRPGKWIRVTEQNNTDIPLEIFLGDQGLPGGIHWRWDWSENLTILRNVGGVLVETYPEEVNSTFLQPPIPGGPLDPDNDGYERFYVRADDPSVVLAQESFMMRVLAWDSSGFGATIIDPGDEDTGDVVHLTAYDANADVDLIIDPSHALPEDDEDDTPRFVPVNDAYDDPAGVTPGVINPLDPDLVRAKIVFTSNAPGFLRVDAPDNVLFWVKTTDISNFLHEDQGPLTVSGDYSLLNDGVYLQSLWSAPVVPEILIEGLEASPNSTDHLVTVSYVYDDDNTTLAADSALLIVSGVDLDVDSDNTNGLSLPDFNDEEEVLEEDVNNSGKVVYLADSLVERYTPLYLSMLSVQAATDDAKLQLTYDDVASGGSLRILTIDGTYLAPGIHDLSVLDIDRSQNDALLWIEVVDSGQVAATQTIQIEIDPDGDAVDSLGNPIEGYLFSDIVRVTPRLDAPAASIFSHDNANYRSVISSDTTVLGMVDDPGDDLAGWQLLLVPVNVHDGSSDQPFVIASSTAEAPGSASSPTTLGTIQPGLLDDGIYQLQLVATDYTRDDNGTMVPDYDRGRVVSGNLIQIQNGLHQQVFVHPETDLALDVTGLPPVTFGRYYDSSQADVDNGLGYGWSLTLPQVRITRLAELADSDDVSSGLRRGDLVTALIPGRGQLSFAFEPKLVDATPGAEAWEPRFVSIDGSGSALGFAWDDVAYRLIEQDGEFFVEELDGLHRTLPYDPASSAGDIFGDSAEAVLPGTYRITMLDGWSYEVDFVAGIIAAATDAFGNTITYSVTGISAGSQTIHIERDAVTGRILWASTDPTGAGPKVTYGYDLVTGDLTSVTDEAGRTTYYTYDGDHRMTSVTDTRGVEQIAVGYEADGRVTSIDRLATEREPGVVPEGAEYVYNERNELIRIIQAQFNAQGGVTGYSIGAFTYEHVDLDDADFEPVFRTFDLDGVTYRYTEAAFIRTVKQSTWLPFEIGGTDTAGLRYTQAPEVKTGEVTFRAWPENFDGTDLTLLDHLGVPVQQARLAADGKTWLIGDAEYAHTTNQATTTIDPFGNVVTNTYDAAGNLIEVLEVDPDGNVLDHLKHVYTAAGMTSYTYALDGVVADVSGLASGLWLETVRVLDETTLAEVSLGRNVYYGAAAPAGRAGRLEQATDRDGISTRYTYWADGNVKESFREWVEDGNAISVRESYAEYNAAGQITLSEDVFGNQTHYHYDALGRSLAVEDRFGGYTFSTYDARGNLIRRITPAGIETRWTYNEDNLLTHVSDSFISESVFTFDPQQPGLALAWDTTSSTTLGNDATYAVTEYLYDSLDRSIGTVRHDSASIQISIDTDPVVNSTIAPAGLQLLETAADLSSATSLYTTSTYYDGAGRVVETVGATGLRRGTIFNNAGFAVVSGVLKSSAPAPGSGFALTLADFENATEFRYDAWNQDKVILDGTPEENDVVTLTFMNRQGDQQATVSVTVTAGQSAADVISTLASAINASADPLVQQVSATLDADDNIQLTLDPDADFLLTADIIAGAGNHGEGGTPLPLVYADGSLRSTWSRDANGHTTLDIMNAQGRVIKTVFHDGTFTERPVDTLGAPITRPDLDTPTTIPTAELDGSHSVSTVQRDGTDPVLATHSLYDGSGNLSDVWLPAVNDPVTASPTYNTLVRPHYAYEYDAHGSVTAITDPNGNRTEFTYDTLGRQTSRTLPIGVATTGDPTDFTETRHFNDTPIGQLAGDLSFSVGSGQLAYEVDFEGRVTAYRYDNTATGRGRLAGKYYYNTEADYNADAASGGGTLTAAARSVTYTYNAFGQVTQADDSGHGVTDFVYDDLGRRTQIASPEGVLNYAYNDLSQVTRVWTSKTTAATDAVTDTTYTYDAYGRLETVTATERADVLVASGGDTTTYFYDAVGNLDAQTVENGTSTVTTDYQFDALNRLTGLYHFEDLNADLTYDTGTETLHASFVYTLDSRGNRTQSVDTVDGDTYTYTWTYDALNRLTSEQLDASDNALDYTDTFVYDLAGNRLSKTRDKGSDASVEETTTYTYDANDRLLTESFDSTESGGTADDRYTVYGYNGTTQTGKTVHEGLDATGTTRSQTSMTYNAMGRLASTTVSTYDTAGVELSEVVTEYGYIDSGLRVTETTTTDGGTPVVKTFLFDPRNPTGFAQVLEEYIDGVLDQVFTLGHDVIAQTDVSDPQDQDVYTLLSDGHGSTRALIDDLNAIIQQFAYDAYGNMLEGANLTTATAALTSLLYSGEWTQANGSQYLRARFYDPSSGRFNRLDPFIGNQNDPQSLHKYLYAHANPVMGMDPSGERFWGIAALRKLAIDVAVHAVYNFVRVVAIARNVAIAHPILAQAARWIVASIFAGLNVYGYRSDPDQYINEFNQSLGAGIAAAPLTPLRGAGFGAAALADDLGDLWKGARNNWRGWRGFKPSGTNPVSRLPRSNGSWTSGTPGDGAWKSNKPEVNAVTGGRPVQFNNGRPDFTPWERGRITFKKGQLDGSQNDFNLVYDYIARERGLSSRNAAKNYLSEAGLTPHHLDNRTIQLVPSDLHSNIPHVGSASDLRGGF